MIGKTISHYKILDKIGEGGMGVVYKAFDTKLERTVALKVLRPEAIGDPDAKKRFIREAKAASALNHPNITTIHEIGEWHGRDFICMEYIDGQTVKQKIKSGEMALDEVLSIAAQVADALREAHEHDITHRDIKSENIMVTPKGQVKVMDFGLAKLKGAATLTKTGSTMGTIAYMSPEQARGEDVDHRTDIWSLGVVLYEMITGQLPFKGEFEQSIIYSILNQDPKLISELRSGVPDTLENIVEKSLEKNPAKRYQQTDELIAELDQLNEDLSVKPFPFRKRIRRKISKKRFSYWKAAGVLLLLVSLIFAGYFFIDLMALKKQAGIETIGGANVRRSVAIMYFENNTGDESLDYWRQGLADLMITDLSQSKYLNVVSGNRLFNILSKLNFLELKRYSSEVLNLIAKQANASCMIVGTFSRAGSTFRLNVMLQESNTGEILASQKTEGQGEASIFSMVDELTTKIKTGLNLSTEEMADDIDENVGKITTSSPEAFKYYLQGRKFHYSGDFEQSIRLMEKAIAIDSTFAMAYRSMANTYANLGYGTQRRKYLHSAFKLRDRVSERERYLIEAENAATDKETIEIYTNLLKLYPDDEIGDLKLAGCYLCNEQWDQAISHGAIHIQNKAEAYHFYIYQAYAEMAKGSYDKATEVLEYYLNNVAANPIINLFLAGNFLSQRKYDLALAETDKIQSLASGQYYLIYTRGDIYLCQGDLIHAEEQYRLLLASSDKATQLYGKWRLGMLYLLQGKFEDSRSQYENGLDLAKQIGDLYWESDFHSSLSYHDWTTGNPTQVLKECDKAGNNLHFKALAFIELGKIDSAQNAANRLIVEIENSTNKKQIRYYYQLLGRIELKRGNWQEAIQQFQQALFSLSSEYLDVPQLIGLCDHALFFDPLAQAYYQAGDREKACETYEKITLLTYGRIGYGDIYAKSFYMLGKIYEQIGWKHKALDNYTKFIALWQDCDPPFQPLVAEARQRVEKLK